MQKKPTVEELVSIVEHSLSFLRAKMGENSNHATELVIKESDHDILPVSFSSSSTPCLEGDYKRRVVIRYTVASADGAFEVTYERNADVFRQGRYEYLVDDTAKACQATLERQTSDLKQRVELSNQQINQLKVYQDPSEKEKYMLTLGEQKKSHITLCHNLNFLLIRNLYLNQKIDMRDCTVSLLEHGYDRRYCFQNTPLLVTAHQLVEIQLYGTILHIDPWNNSVKIDQKTFFVQQRREIRLHFDNTTDENIYFYSDMVERDIKEFDRTVIKITDYLNTHEVAKYNLDLVTQVAYGPFDDADIQFIVGVIESLPPNKRLSAVKEKGRTGDTVLHNAARVGKVECLKLILDLCPEDQRLAAVREKDKYGHTVLHGVIAQRKVECLKLILDLYPEDQRLAAVREKDKKDRTVFYSVIGKENVESLKLILEWLPKDHRLAAVKEKNKVGDTVLHYIARGGTVEELKLILNLYPEDQLLAAVKEKDQDGSTVLQQAVEWENAECLKLFLERLPKDQLLDAVKEKNGYGQTVFHCVTVMRSVECLKLILERLPKDQLLDAVKEKDGKGNTVLCYVASQGKKEEFLKLMVERLPKVHRLKVVNESLFSHAFKNDGEQFKKALDLLSKEDWLIALRQKNKNGESVFNTIFKNGIFAKLYLDGAFLSAVYTEKAHEEIKSACLDSSISVHQVGFFRKNKKIAVKKLSRKEFIEHVVNNPDSHEASLFKEVIHSGSVWSRDVQRCAGACM